VGVFRRWPRSVVYFGGPVKVPSTESHRGRGYPGDRLHVWGWSHSVIEVGHWQAVPHWYTRDELSTLGCAITSDGAAVTCGRVPGASYGVSGWWGTWDSTVALGSSWPTGDRRVDTGCGCSTAL
jgi:hypothetical protein